ncbi:MAG: glycosyltransferase family 4 protein [Anaerolineales bacterium]|nr:glycosyltransferase family 4 protein [Anaerolineales bacterium]
MLIGIDASRSVAQERTGTENYSLNLIRHLLALQSEHRYRLYFNRAPSFDLLATCNLRSFAQAQDRPATCNLRIMPFPRLWTHLRLSWEMARRPPDLLFVPAHVLPIVHPRRSVVTIHDLGYLYYPQAHRLLDRLYLDLSTRYNARAATRLIADSSATKQDLIERYGSEPDKITVVYPGYDEATFQTVRDEKAIRAVKAKYDIVGDYILFVGTLQPRKNLTRLIEAFSNIQYPISNIQLLIAGKKGWLYEKIFRQVEELGLEGRVVFTGYVAEGDLPALLSGARLFVFPSLYEGFGLPVLEAMACGTPVVCSNASSLPEVAGDAAVLVDPLDVEELAAAMERVLGDEKLRAGLIERGFEQAKKFSWEKCAHETLGVLESV